MKIAYFIMVHHKPDQFAWLLDAIWNPHDHFLVHVDLKSRLLVKPARRGVHGAVRRIAAGRPNVALMPSRFINWGGWSLSRIMLDAIDLLLDRAGDWSYFVNLSGQCYPLKSQASIHDRLAAADPANFVEVRPIADLPPDDWHLRREPMIELPVRTIALPGPRRPPEGFALEWKGSQWCMLTRAFCAWQRRSELRRRVARYLRHQLLSDELIIQTLLMNGPFRDTRAGQFGRVVIWPGPKVLTSADRELLDTTSALFGRKFDEVVDAGILHHLACRHGFPQPRRHALGFARR